MTTVGTLAEVEALTKDFEKWAADCEAGNSEGFKGTLVLDVDDQKKIAHLLRRHVDLLKVIYSVEQPNLEFTSSAYLVNDGAVLLVLHKRFGQWVPVGGRRKAGERPHEVALRELEEETGITDATFMDERMVDLPGMPKGLIGYHEHDAGRGATHMNFAFAMNVQHRNIMLCDEHDGAKWVTPEDVPAMKMPENVLALVTKLHKLSALAYPA